MSKQIPLTQGKFAIVDDEDFEWLSKYKWHTVCYGNVFYAARTTGKYPHQYQILMHREILGLESGDGINTDHVNHNGLDNRWRNIRVCTCAQNQQNRRPNEVSTSKYKGVSWYKRLKKWQALIECNQRNFYLGLFSSEIDAAKAYDKKAKELFGEFACTNF